eukprot:GFUD01076636.1.p1 GENE.GFUD01076636.1~~GFUD01076636.1.p1  ORF type:complete len:145 (-),score=21.90 GFUD01076636.1:81-515(-)
MDRIFLILTCLLAPALGGKKYNLEEMATSACIGISPTGYETVVAVRRWCNAQAPDCNTMCTNAAPFENGVANGGFTCFNSIHVHKKRPSLGKRPGGTQESTPPPNVGKYGPIIHKYGSNIPGIDACTTRSCGPNYCCCSATLSQ